MHPLSRTACVLFAAAALGACAKNADGPARRAVEETIQDAAAVRSVPAGRYTEVFSAMRDTLRNHGFLLERVDAFSGVITTQPKGTAGLATPWDPEQQTAGDELSDLAHRHQRVVRVTFAPESADDAQTPSAPSPLAPTRPGETPTDLRTATGPLTMRVVATVYRLHTSGGKLSTLSITQSTQYVDTNLEQRAMLSYSVATGQDSPLAHRLADQALKGSTEPPAAAGGPSASSTP
jgi:hypothetical protein